MKYNHIHAIRINIAIIAVSLILMCQNIIAQPGYRPWFRMVPYQSGNDPYSRTQSDRQVYNPWFHMGGDQPFISLGIHFDPLISWFSTNSYDTRSEGAVAGINFGISYNKYFSPNYSFSSGINIVNTGGRLSSTETTNFELKNYSGGTVTVQPGDPIIYRIRYLSVPLGLKLQTSQIGYRIFFIDIGFDPKILIGGRADIPSLNIKGGNAMPELRTFNLSYHFMAGIEYPMGGNNKLVIGFGFDNNLFDITRDNGNRPWDVVTNKSLSFRAGIIF